MTDKEYEYCYKHYFKPVKGYLMLYCRSKEKCEDITQDAFIKLWERRKHIRFKTVRQWLHALTYNRMMDVLRRERYKDRYRFEASNVAERKQGEQEDKITSTLDLEMVLGEIERLPKRNKDVLIDRMNGVSYKQMCKKYNLSMPNLKSRVHKSRRLLNNRIKHNGNKQSTGANRELQ